MKVTIIALFMLGLSACSNIKHKQSKNIYKQYTRNIASVLNICDSGPIGDLIALQVLAPNCSQVSAVKLASLTYLDLHNNQITEIPTGAFDKLTSLQYLDLDKNQITEIPTGVFDKLTSLQSLSLANNQIGLPQKK